MVPRGEQGSWAAAFMQETFISRHQRIIVPNGRSTLRYGPGSQAALANVKQVTTLHDEARPSLVPFSL